METFELVHLSNSIAFCNLDYDKTGSDPMHSDDTTFSIKVISNFACEPFSGIGFCKCEMKELVAFAKQMEELYNFRRQNVKFQNICYYSN